MATTLLNHEEEEMQYFFPSTCSLGDKGKSRLSATGYNNTLYIRLHPENNTASIFYADDTKLNDSILKKEMKDAFIFMNHANE